MERQKRKIPVFRLVAYAIMIVGILLFVLTPFFIRYLKLDTDVLGILVVLAGLAVLILGLAIRLVVGKGKGRQT
jgi:sulfite exporter TauE/SafE